MNCKRVIYSCFQLFLLCIFVFACSDVQPVEKSLEQKSPVPLPQACKDACMYSDSIVSVSLANQWIDTYRASYGNSPRAFFYSLDDVRDFLNNANTADGLRVYFSTCDSNTQGNSYVDNMRLLLSAVKDTTDVLGDSLLGYDMVYTKYLGQPHIFNDSIVQQNFNSDCGASNIEIERAAEMTKRWRNAQHNAGRHIQAYTFCLDYICALLDAGNGGKQASGIRFYVGMEHNDFKLIMVAVDAVGDNIYTNTRGSQSVDFSAPCPQFCGESNQLNSDL